MDCTHPVLYTRNGALVCHICGAAVEEPHRDEQTPAPQETPPEGAKKPAKRRAKAKAD